jgi:two-component system heavy metal sensor histidine kinase CusS
MRRLLRAASWSLTARLSIYFAVCSGVLIAAMGYVLYRENVRGFREEHIRLVTQKVEALRRTLGAAREVPGAAADVWKEFALPASSLRVAVFDERGELLFAPADFPVPRAELAPPLEADDLATHAVTPPAGRARRYRVATAWAVLAGEPAHRVMIALALDISSSYRRMEIYHRTLFATLVAGVLCAALLGYFIARQGLAPLRRIARAANDITSARLDRRLELAGAPAELRELATAFNAMIDRLAESFTRLSQFSSDIAHELRTPLNNLLGEAQVTLARARSADEYRAVLESSVEEVEHLARMIENMLFLARAERPETTVSAAWFDAREELEKVADFYGIMAAETQVRIHCSGAGRAYADAALFRRAVGNLLSNALRHTEAGGEISMRVAIGSDGAASIAVSNPGRALPGEHRARIFERFYRAEPSRSKSGEGAGLGLAIVQTIMRLHRGTVSLVRGAPDLNIFTLRFPPPGAGA